MVQRQWKPLIVSGGLFVLILVASVAMFEVGGHWKRRVLFFPGLDGVKLSGESRFLPRRSHLEARISQLTEEAVLGPMSPALRRYLPRETEVQSVVVRQGVAYVSVSWQVLAGTEEYHGTTRDALQALANTILYNFHRVRKLYLLVDGQIPRGMGEDGFSFDKKSFR
jgi:hypothetical protein